MTCFVIDNLFSPGSHVINMLTIYVSLRIHYCPKSHQLSQKRNHLAIHYKTTSQPAFACSKLTRETLKQGVKYAQN